MKKQEKSVFTKALEAMEAKNELTYFKMGIDKPANLSFKNLLDLQNWIELLDSTDKVFLLVIQDDTLEYSKIIIDDESSYISTCLDGHALSEYFHLHEYPSYETAYEVALLMREGNHLYN